MITESKTTDFNDGKKERLTIFSDGIFAIIITIMVLELKKPEEPTFEALFQLWPTWISYAVSYTFIAIVWVNHHYLLGHAARTTTRLIWANFGHLFSVSLIPFLTVWVAESHLAAVPVGMYAFAFLVVNLTYLVLVWETLCDTGSHKVQNKAMWVMHARTSFTLFILFVAMVLAFWLPFVGFALVCFCLLLYLRPDPELPRLKRTSKDK